MRGSRIDIDRVPLTIVAAASAGRAEHVTRRVRDAVARTLPSALASACGRDDDADPAYVFIDRLDVHCAVATHWADDAIAALFAERLARALLLARSLGHALVFRDRPEFLSAFLAAAVDGQAFSRWWFAEFDGLAALPVSACVRTLILAERAAAWEALTRLSPEPLHRVVTTLTAPDAERLLAAVAAERDGAAASLQTAIAALDATRDVPLPTRMHRLVAALVHVGRGQTSAASAKTLSALRGLAAIVEAARSGGLHGIPQDASTATVLAWCDAAGVDDVDRAVALEFDASRLVEYVAAQMAEPSFGAAPAPGGAAFDDTPFGGALLLCAVLVRVGWWVAWRDALRAAGVEERADRLAAWLALAVVARALSPGEPRRVERDPVLRRAFGAPDAPRPVPSDRETKRALRYALAVVARAGGARPGRRRLGPMMRAAGRALLVETGRRIPGCDGSTAAYLRTRCLSLPASLRADGGAARLGRAPLDVLLVFSGLKRAELRLPCGRMLVLREEAAW